MLGIWLNAPGFGLRAVFGYHSGILSTRAVHGALQLRCREIHMKQTEAHTVAMIPLKVIQQRPGKISLYIHSIVTDSCKTNTSLRSSSEQSSYQIVGYI